MNGVRMRARADVRARPLSLVLVTLLIGLIGAIGVTAFAGARRTDTAYARFRQATNAPEAFTVSCPRGGPWKAADLDAIGRLPEVASATAAMVAFTYVTDAQGRPQFYDPANDGAMAVATNDVPRPGDVAPRVLEGRLPTAPDEMAVGYGTTELPRPGVGDDVTVGFAPQAVIDAGGQPTPDTEMIEVPMRVVGRVLMPGELSGESASIWLSPGFFQTQPDAWTCDVAYFNLRGGLADVPRFMAGVSRLAPGAVTSESSSEALFVARTTGLQTVILSGVAFLAALAGVMVLGQTLVRRTSLGAIDTPILRALGMTKREIVLSAVFPALVVALGGALVAIVGAIAASGLFPGGVAGVAEPDPGFRVDVSAVGLGVALIVVTTLLSVALPARRLASARGGVEGTIEYAGAERRSRLAAWIGRLPLPPPAGAGARLALEAGHGRSATPVRSTLAGLVVAVVAMVASFGFSASMSHFGSTASLSGLTFDIAGGAPFSGDLFQAQVVPTLIAEPGLRDVEAGNFQELLVLEGPGGSSQEAAWAFESVKGEPVRTTMLEGDWPRAPDEIALGRQSLGLLGADVGDTIRATAGGETREMTIVGIPVFPDFGFGPGLGRGAGVTMDGLRTFYPDVMQNLALANVVPGADPRQVVDRISAELPRDFRRAGILDVAQGDIVRGATVRSTLRSGSLPLRLSLLFAFAAFATLVHLLLTSVRRRRRDLAILQTLGFRRGQVMATVMWQALILTGLALAIGVPLGILAGRFAWNAFAYRLGIVPESVVSSLSFVVIPVSMVASLLVATGPGLVARRTKPAAVLKAE